MRIILQQASETILEFDSYFVPRVGETIQVRVVSGMVCGVLDAEVTAWKVDTVRWLVDATKPEETVLLGVSMTWIADENQTNT